jgi:hypothetical protein
MFGINRDNKVTVSPLSNFVKNTSSHDKKKVYEKVLKSASKLQNLMIEKSRENTSVCN